ncbi:HTH_Tnp_Tc3_2 domain-containing protein [Trichonephila clavipes]|nr:HTH_Tnp_Tc3_2 domain-containing protein [Trichonephila clavipes]
MSFDDALWKVVFTVITSNMQCTVQQTWSNCEVVINTPVPVAVDQRAANSLKEADLTFEDFSCLRSSMQAIGCDDGIREEGLKVVFKSVNSGRFQHRDGSSRPGATSDREDRLIVRAAVTACDSSLSTIRRTTRTRVSTMTIHRRLMAYARTELLRYLSFTPARYRARLQGCLARSDWNHADWGDL